MAKTVRLGVFLVVTLAILAAGVFLIGSKQLLFHSTYILKAQFQNVGGLIDGAGIRVGGIQEGTVRQIVLPNHVDGTVMVEMNLERATRNVIRSDSVASIQTDGLLGDKYIEVSFGSPAGKVVKDGDTIRGEPPLDMSALFKKTDDILDQAQDAMHNVNTLTAKIASGNGTVGKLISDNTVYQQMSAGATDFQENMEALKHNFLLRGFFKKRGYEDSADLTKDEVQNLPAGPLEKKFTFDAKKLFDKADTAKLTNPKDLREVGEFLQANPFGLAVVVVHAGMKGDEDKQRQLTQARAAVVREYLVNNYRTNDTRVKTLGMGKGPEPESVDILVYPAEVKAPATAERSKK